ncbi:DUF2090 domain-containing protein [Candidatus Uhrbacteria bacterium]|nr:DUF2090 domain-containing protein [Candidatus Uhrbacteria bacterium]
MTPLFILPFDHRSSFARDLLGKIYPVKGADKKKLIECKNVIFDGILWAKARYKGNGALATIIDEEFGTPVIRAAKKHGVPFALTTEAPGHDEFAFIHGAGFGAALRRVKPTFAKALVSYTPGNEKPNAVARKRLKALSAWCEKEQMDFMLEVLVGDMPESKKEAAITRTIDEMHAAGIRPTVWKIEGLPTAQAWKRLAKHTDAQLIMLGRGESQKQVDAWLAAAAHSGKAIGFAIGRTVFLKPLAAYVAGSKTREETVEAIGKNYLRAINRWHKEAR